MKFEWNENKRSSNLEKHGIDFIDAAALFAAPYLLAPAKTSGDEERWLATGRIEDVFVTAIFTIRNETIRIISMRRARDDERRAHQEKFG